MESNFLVLHGFPETCFRSAWPLQWVWAMMYLSMSVLHGYSKIHSTESWQPHMGSPEIPALCSPPEYSTKHLRGLPWWQWGLNSPHPKFSSLCSCTGVLGRPILRGLVGLRKYPEQSKWEQEGNQLGRWNGGQWSLHERRLEVLIVFEVSFRSERVQPYSYLRL